MLHCACYLVCNLSKCRVSKKEYEIELKVFFVYKKKVLANNLNRAMDIARDSAGDYMEEQVSTSRKFDEFLEYQIEYETLKTEEL